MERMEGAADTMQVAALGQPYGYEKGAYPGGCTGNQSPQQFDFLN
jgi:hypothetical protein